MDARLKYLKKNVGLIITANLICAQTWAMAQAPRTVSESQPINEPINKPMNQPVNQPVNQPAGPSSTLGSADANDSAANQSIRAEQPALISSLTPPDFNVFTEVAYPVGQLLDAKFQSYRELLPVRNANQADKSDACDLNTQNQDRFADRIAYAVELKMHPSKAGLGYVGSYYGLNSDEANYFPTSLISHPICKVTSASLKATLGGKNIPSASTIKKANLFADTLNNYRRLAAAGDRESYVKVARLWSKFLMCTSYTESLTTADTASSDRVASKYAPPSYRRPAGVLFYEDPYQNAASKLNLGLFQFTPNSAGNIQACLREWNKLYPSCALGLKSSQAEMIKTLGSSLQSFNAFCGAAKITGTFAVQVNTTKTSSTHPANFLNGKLKAPEDRCVSVHFAAGKAYNHFGPFQNTTGENLEEVLSCTLDGEI